MSIDKDDLDRLAEILGGALPPGVKIGGIHSVKLGLGEDREPLFRPATLAHLQGLMKGTYQPKFEIGDIVVLRDWAKNDFKWPKEGDRCIVTQVLDVPFREGEPGTSQSGRRNDIALAFVGGPGGGVSEFLHDSRMYEKVGSIHDPITLPDGEVLPTH